MIAENALAANLVLIVFIGLVGGNGFAFFRQNGCTLSEAAAFSLMTLLMIQAWVSQVVLLAGATPLYAPCLLLAAVPGLISVSRIPRIFTTQFKAVIAFGRKHPLAAVGLLAGWGYAAAVAAWPMVRLQGVVLEELGPIWQHSGSILTLGRTATDAALPVLNHVVFTAPWQPPLALGTANLAAYLTIGFGTYALARRYAWPPMAITVTLLVVSMTRLVLQSLTADSELLPAAAALTAILSLYRSVERPRGQDLILLVSAISFSVSGGRLCYLMPLILIGLSVVVLVRRYGAHLWGKDTAPGKYRRAFVVLGIAAILAVFSQSVVVAANITAGHEWIGATHWDRVVFNSDALLGTVANMLRYLILSIDLPDFIERSCRWVFGISLLGGLKQFYYWMVSATLDGRGAAASFDWSWTAPQRLTWFGPVGFLLVIPSIFIAFWRGPHRLKSTALAILVYGAMIALIVAWRPENVRLMTRFFVCGGFFMAFALPPWRFSRTGRLLLQLFGILSITHAILT